jgi:curved DNA-binding protein CbpA
VTHYETLGVEPTADAPTIKRAWRRAARDNHPDRHPGDAGAAARFKAASQAWDVLRNPGTRQEYDATLRAAPRLCMRCGDAAFPGLPVCLPCGLVAAEAAADAARPPASPEPVVDVDPNQRPEDYAPAPGRPASTDELLGALLGEAAIRGAAVRVDVHVSGDRAHRQFVRQVTRNLKLANRLVEWWMGTE